MDAILFSARVNVDDARKHLEENDKLYWEMPLPIAKQNFSFPIQGFIHVKGKQVEYEAEIVDIIPYNPANYQNSLLLEKVKPVPWRTEWRRNPGAHKWKSTLVITKIEPFSIETTSLKKYDGTPVKKAPQGNYVRILPPNA